MNINQKISTAIRAYPIQYRCRTDVLHHWFCVNGNGMKWKKGRLVDDYKTKTKSIDAIIAVATDHLRVSDCYGSAEISAKQRVRIAKITSDLTFTYNNAEDLASVSWDSNGVFSRGASGDFPAKSIYPLCKYACMNSVPDDVNPEYLAAVREMIIAVFCSDSCITAPRTTTEQRAASLRNNIEFASNILTELAERFGDGGMVTSYDQWQNNRNNAIRQVLAALNTSTGDK